MNIVSIKTPNKKITGTISIPGSKSYTNRALIMAAMTKGNVVIHNPLISDDIYAMVNCLNTLGITTKVLHDSIIVSGDYTQVEDKHYNLDCDISGTTIRFLLSLLCVIPGTKKLYGKEGLNKRPIGELVSGLKQLGADIEYLDKENFPPLLIKSNNLNPGITKLNGDISSQYFSSLLMITPLIGKIEIQVVGKQISKPYIDMTIDTMEKFGVTITNKNYKKYLALNNQHYSIKQYTVEGDYSSAGYFFAIAALTKSSLTLKNLNPYSKQADRMFLDILKKTGIQVTLLKNGIKVKGNGVKPINIDMENCPDQVQTMAVLSSFANGVTKITGVRSLRVKETERVKALEAELKKMGIKTKSTHDTLTIYGGDPKPAQISTYGDHRMAMSFTVAGTKLAGMKIENPEVVSKTFPEFWDKLQEIGVYTENEK